MKSLRAAFRLTGLSVFTALMYCTLLVTTVLFFRNAARRRAWRNGLFARWARVAGRLIGMRTHIEGPVPQPRSFVVSNHLGYVDILLLGQCLPAVFVSKAEIADWPLLGRLVRSAGTIFVNRSSRRDLVAANHAIEAALDAGHSVILFAEGTSSSGATVMPLKPSLLQVPASLNLPVYYAAIAYQTPVGEAAAANAVCWWGDMAFPGHFMTLLKLPFFDAYLRFGEQPVTDSDRKALARRLRESIVAEQVPVF